MKQLLSLFDYSGSWSEPYREAGWEVHQWDIKLADFLDINLLDSCETLMDIFPYDIDGILAAVPCTDFAASGAQYWKTKDKDGRTFDSMELVRQVQRIADFFKPTDPDYELEQGKFFWCIENPVGRIPKLFPELGKPYIFNPYEFAGYTDLTYKEWQEIQLIRKKALTTKLNKKEIDLVLKSNCYTKKTCLFGEFNKNLIKKSVEPIKVCGQGSPVQLLGGKSEKTKELRSITPAGFAKAFYQANDGSVAINNIEPELKVA